MVTRLEARLLGLRDDLERAVAAADAAARISAMAAKSAADALQEVKLLLEGGR